MKAEELMIGNYIMFHNEEILTTWEDIRFMITSKHQDKYHKPIPLTEEWLVKFGFVLKDDYVDIKYYENGTRFGVCLNHDDLEFYRIGGKKNEYIPLIYDESHFQHVHQLQNLYFALTGEELQIKV